MKKAILIVFASMFLFACGGGDKDEDETTVDAGTTKTDAGTEADAGTTPTCLVAANLGSPVPVAQESFSGTLDDGAAFIAAYADLNTDADYVGVELFDGFGAFTTGGLRTGTFQLTGDELNFDTCGVCVSIGADFDAATGESVQGLMATGGTVVIESISGSFKATLTNVTFGEADATGALVPGGCTSTLTSLAIDTPIVAE